MYGPLRDIFCDLLGYPRSSVHIDIAGEAGRPDVTCRAPSGIMDRNGKSLDIDWMVVEAKDEHDAFSTAGKREAIFAQKAKYIRPDTAWFIMADPTVIVARPVMNSTHDSANDIVFALDSSADETSFRNIFARLSYGVAGVPQRLKAFREGDVSLIATEKLTVPEKATILARTQIEHWNALRVSSTLSSPVRLRFHSIGGKRGRNLIPNLVKITPSVTNLGAPKPSSF